MPTDPNCPACREKRRHTDEEWKLHPGEGRQGEYNRPERPEMPITPEAAR
jgi:hypothetical protein